LNNTFFQLKSFITYWLDNVDEHSLHSPFFFKFYTEVLKGELPTTIIDYLESQRRKLLSDERTLTVEDLGSGSTHFMNNERSVSSIAKTSVNPRKYSSLYSRIISVYNYKNIVELGTSLGLNTLYLGVSPISRVITFEGSDSIADLAEELFKSNDADNIKIVRGNIDSTLPTALSAIDTVDFAFIDANHRYAPTLRYFDVLAARVNAEGIIALDDIHSSPEMEDAWNVIIQDDRVYATADLFRCGLVFFNPSLNKQHVVLRF
jgi:predicted O-methyltransferase YrrM